MTFLSRRTEIGSVILLFFGYIDTYEWAECKAARERTFRSRYVHKRYGFQTKIGFILSTNVQQFFVLFPTLLTMKEAPKHANKYSKSLNDLHHEFSKIDFDSLISKNYKNHFRLFRLHFHNSLQQHHKKCSWNWSILEWLRFKGEIQNPEAE